MFESTNQSVKTSLKEEVYYEYKNACWCNRDHSPFCQCFHNLSLFALERNLTHKHPCSDDGLWQNQPLRGVRKNPLVHKSYYELVASYWWSWNTFWIGKVKLQSQFIRGEIQAFPNEVKMLSAGVVLIIRSYCYAEARVLRSVDSHCAVVYRGEILEGRRR